MIYDRDGVAAAQPLPSATGCYSACGLAGISAVASNARWSVVLRAYGTPYYGPASGAGSCGASLVAVSIEPLI